MHNDANGLSAAALRPLATIHRKSHESWHRGDKKMERAKSREHDLNVSHTQPSMLLASISYATIPSRVIHMSLSPPRVPSLPVAARWVRLPTGTVRACVSHARMHVLIYASSMSS